MADLDSICFKDTVFLERFGLSEMNALDYFSLSPFYDQSCINEQLKMQARYNDLSQTNLNIEYPKLTKKYDRKSYRVKIKVELLELYYIVQGTVYQAPKIQTLFDNRLITSLSYLGQAFETAQQMTQKYPETPEMVKNEQAEREFIKRLNALVIGLN